MIISLVLVMCPEVASLVDCLGTSEAARLTPIFLGNGVQLLFANIGLSMSRTLVHDLLTLPVSSLSSEFSNTNSQWNEVSNCVSNALTHSTAAFHPWDLPNIHCSLQQVACLDSFTLTMAKVRHCKPQILSKFP